MLDHPIDQDAQTASFMHSMEVENDEFHRRLKAVRAPFWPVALGAVAVGTLGFVAIIGLAKFYLG